MKTILKVFLVLIVICVVTGIGFTILVGSAFGTFDKDYTLDDLKANFDLKQKEIYEAKKYFYSILPEDTKVDIEFQNDNELFYFNVFKDNEYYNISDKNIHSEKVDSLLNLLGWTRNNLKELKIKLDKANCISYDKSDEFKIGFQRSGMGKYYFRLLDKPLNDSIKAKLNQNCIYIHNDSVIFDYGGGAIEEDCLYNQ